MALPRLRRLLPLASGLCLMAGCSTTDSSSKPDLSFSSGLTWTPSDPQDSETVAVSFTVANNHDSAVSAVKWSVTVDGVANVISGTIGSISANSSTNQTFTIQKAVGQHAFKVLLDPDDTIDESNEDNNSTSSTIEWSAAAPAVTFSSAAITSSGTTGSVSFRLRNAKTTQRTAYWRLVDATAGGTVTTGSVLLDGSSTSDSISQDVDSTIKNHTFRLDVADSTDFSPVLDQVSLTLASG